MTSLEVVYAIHDFKAENEDELDFLMGEAIIVLQKDDGFDDGWWKGQNIRDQVGIFPMSYITFEDPFPSDTIRKNPSRPVSSTNSSASSHTQRQSAIHTLLLPKLRFTPPEEWDMDQVEIWLHEMGFGSIAANFKNQEITGDILLALDMNALKELNVPTFGKRFKLHTALTMLRKECGYQPPQHITENSHLFHQQTNPNITQEMHSQNNNTNNSFDSPQADLKRIELVLQKPQIMSLDECNHSDEMIDMTPDMEGWLFKQGCRYKKWNKRWFVLKGPNLFYFKSPEDVRMKGIINLRGYRVIPDETIQPGKYSFKAQHTGERTFYFYTDLDTSMRQWITNLMKATISRDFNAPVLSSSVIPTVSLGVARRMRPRPPSILLSQKSTPTIQSPLMDDNSLLQQDSGFESHHGDSENENFSQWFHSTSISDLKELRQSDVLIDLLEELSNKQLKQATLGRSMTDSLTLAFEFLYSENIIQKNQCTVQDIQNDNQEKMLVLLQSIYQWSNTP
ncbi:uncharacterized protein B0P05DRAFT_560663, partial [Gilbertella persicaria]|uniref:uncharacterized protein n=1 Tax=Gilbertella persicaria TaxID=101096 RepID=UPI00221E9B86